MKREGGGGSRPAVAAVDTHLLFHEIKGPWANVSSNRREFTSQRDANHRVVGDRS